MTRYTAEHKGRTRQRLLDAARREFRQRGFDSCSIDNLMKAAGLTRGGFYAHFDSKEALIREVLRLEPGLLREIRQVSKGEGAGEEAAKHLRAYLDPQQRDELIYCPLVAHPMDAIRGGPERTALYEQQVRGLVDALRDVAGEEREAVLMTVLAVGAAILSSAMTDHAFADRVENICKDEIESRLAKLNGRSPRSR